MQRVHLKEASGRPGANKQRAWAHIGYWQRQDTIIGLNSSSDWNYSSSNAIKLQGDKAMAKAWTMFKS